MSPRRRVPPALKHYVWYDEPSATSKRSQRAVCGSWVAPYYVVMQREQITCLSCARTIRDFDNRKDHP